MAASVTLNHFHLLPYDDQVALERLLDEPITEKYPIEEKQGWFIRVLPDAFVTKIITSLPPLITGLVNLYKPRYSYVTLAPQQAKAATPTTKQKRINTGGNFCGHNPKLPRFVMRHHAYFAKQDIDDLGNKRRPQILYDIVERIKAYYHDTDVIPVLQNANFNRRTSDRQRRSEYREAIVNILSVMVMNMDLASLRVGQPMVTGGFFNYSVEWLAKKANLSKSRAKRALSDLNDSTLISSYQYRELIDKEKKEYIAHNAARVFDYAFFRMLNIDLQKFSKARKMSHQKHKDKQAQHRSIEDEKAEAVARLNMNKVMRDIDPQKNQLKSANLPEHEEERRKANRMHKQRTQVFLELSDDPRYQHDDAAFDRALKQRLKALNLLHDHEQAS